MIPNYCNGYKSFHQCVISLTVYGHFSVSLVNLPAFRAIPHCVNSQMSINHKCIFSLSTLKYNKKMCSATSVSSEQMRLFFIDDINELAHR